MSTCDLVSEDTVGVCKPKTFGTVSGELSRSFFNDWTKEIRAKEMERSAVRKWIAYRAKQVKEYYRKKYANRSQGIQRYKRKGS